MNQPTDYEVRVEPGLIRVTSSRNVTPELIQHFFETVPALAREKGISKVLVDQRNTPGTISQAQRFDYAARLAQAFQGLTLAVVQDDSFRDPRRFGETVAFNRGADLRVCATLEEACEWLGVPLDGE